MVRKIIWKSFLQYTRIKGYFFSYTSRSSIERYSNKCHCVKASPLILLLGECVKKQWLWTQHGFPITIQVTRLGRPSKYHLWMRIIPRRYAIPYIGKQEKTETGTKKQTFYISCQRPLRVSKNPRNVINHPSRQLSALTAYAGTKDILLDIFGGRVPLCP